MKLLTKHGLPMGKKAKKRGRKPGVTVNPYKVKKRGVKPGTRRGKYKKVSAMLTDEAIRLFKQSNQFLEKQEGQSLTLCQQLEETIQRLENRISNSIERLNELIGKI